MQENFNDSFDLQLFVSLGWTKLHCATQRQDLIYAKELINKGNNINAHDRFDRTSLSIAASKGNIKFTKWLLKNGAAVNRGFPIHYAAENGHKEVVVLLIENGADVNLVKDNNYPLIIASRNGHLEVVKILVLNGASVNVTDEVKRNALHSACRSANPELFTFLIDSGCDTNAADKFDTTPLEFCLLFAEDKPELVKILLSKGASPDVCDVQDRNYLHLSTNPIASLELINAGTNVNALDIMKETPLYAAAEGEHTECAKILLEHNADPNLACSAGLTALHLAAQDGNLELIQVLLKHGADANIASVQNVIPLHLAVKHNHVDIIQQLLHHGSLMEVPVTSLLNVNSFGPKFDIAEGQTPLSLAKLHKHFDIVEKLTQFAEGVEAETTEPITDWPRSEIITLVRSNNVHAIRNLQPNDSRLASRDLIGWTSLHHSVANRLYEISCQLIQKGADVNALDNFERTPLSIAAARNDLQIIKLLAENGADVNLGLPLHYAIHEDAVEAVLELIKFNCDVDIQNKSIWESSALIEAASERKSTIVKILLENKANPHLINKIEQTALHNACQFDDLDSCRLLLEYGAKIDVVDNCQDIPFTCAMQNSRYEIIKLLIDKSSDVRWLDSSQWTPLHRSVNRTAEIALELIKTGVDVNYYNDNVESPLYLAASQPEIVKILLENNADVNFIAFGGWSSLHESAAAGNLECVKQFLKHGIDVNVGSAENIIPIYLASMNGHYNVVEELLKRGSYVSPQILDIGVIRVEHFLFPMMMRSHLIVVGNTPVIGAATKGHLEVIKLLHSLGADLNVFNSDGNTALHEAVLGCYEQIVEYLIASKVNIHVKNKNNKTAMDLAKENLNNSIINILKG